MELGEEIGKGVICEAGRSQGLWPSESGCLLAICTGANRSRRFARLEIGIRVQRKIIGKEGIGAEVTALGICSRGAQKAWQIPHRSSIFW